MGLGGRALAWDRFAHWAPGAAMLVLIGFALLLVVAALTDRSDAGSETAPVSSAPVSTSQTVSTAPAASTTQGDNDLQLYHRIAERVAAGENYYQVAVEEQRARDFPVRPGFTVRLPTLAFITALVGTGGLIVLAVLLGILTLVVWWRRLGDEPGGEEHRTISLLLLVIGTGVGFKAQYLVLHEVWAGVLLALSFGLYRRRHWHWAWLAAALALAIREHALPFVLLMGALAGWRRDWREAAAWGGLVLLFLIGHGVHLAQVNPLISDSDPASPAWLVFRGLGGWTSSIILSSPLYLLPGVIAAPLALLPLLGWAGWKSDMGLFGLLLFTGYGLLFMIAGRDNNFYWALMVTPAWFVGLSFLPRSVTSLWNSARGN
ncbi:hypothetical protein GCM10009127_06470 [Alteraurantiacibacter aestuarii]|uniref:hypothetical protein n=1 Tax=Alteraurantiacibacter aestuarii TaxID=650004 RepID=UPI001F3EFFEC|nr:hypothetical protein [Alteraurantiacibacter aestuarii]